MNLQNQCMCVGGHFVLARLPITPEWFCTFWNIAWRCSITLPDAILHSFCQAVSQLSQNLLTFFALPFVFCKWIGSVGKMAPQHMFSLNILALSFLWDYNIVFSNHNDVWHLHLFDKLYVSIFKNTGDFNAISGTTKAFDDNDIFVITLTIWKSSSKNFVEEHKWTLTNMLVILFVNNNLGSLPIITTVTCITNQVIILIWLVIVRNTRTVITYITKSITVSIGLVRIIYYRTVVLAIYNTCQIYYFICRILWINIALNNA